MNHCLDSAQRTLSRVPSAVKVAVKVRNQMDGIIAHYSEHTAFPTLVDLLL